MIAQAVHDDAHPVALRADLASWRRAELEAMRAAGEDVLECYRVLKRTKDNVVGEVLRHYGTFYEWKHYPPGDTHDNVSHAQYFYHAHKKGARVGEHGHFHTFLRAKGMPKGMAPVPYDGAVEWPKGDAALCHLIGVSMDRLGYPTALFTTNRWVTGECWFRAEHVCAALGRFKIDLARPSWPANRWITAMVALFRPVIEELVRERDVAFARWRAQHPERDAFEDRELEVLSRRQISVEEQIAAVRAALDRASG